MISSTIKLNYIPVDKAQRALQNILTDTRLGFVQPIEESNSLLITNFAPTVWTMYQIIRAMDVEAPENQLQFEKISLEYHVAEDLAQIIDQLMEVRSNIRTSAAGGARAPQGGAAPSSRNEAPAPKILPDQRNNALLVYAVEEYMTEIKMLIASLDTAGGEPTSNIHMYELKNTNADEIQEVLAELLGSTSRRGTRASGSGGTQRNQGNAPPGTNQAFGGQTGSTDQDAVNVVADPNTNSLLITATRARFEEIAEIIAKLDKRRPQVLVQCAIVELSDNDLQNIGVELGAVEGGGDEARFFGGTSYGLSTIDTRQNLSSSNTGGNGTGTGNGTGAGGSTITDTFFDDLVRVPNLDAVGLTGGIFQDFIEVPILVNLFKRLDKSNLVSVPSVLVNDNQEAHIIVGNEIPTTNINQGQFSDQQSFGGYQEASLELTISPHISNDDYLRLNIRISVQAFTGAQASASIPPPRTTREVETAITVQSGKTVVIGGLITDNFRETVQGIPYLMDIPILGELFKKTDTTVENTTLYVFLTPTILKDFDALERISYERKLEVAKLNGQISLVDPNFRVIELDDEKISIEQIESTGHLDLPQYRVSVGMKDESAPAPNADGVPVKPAPAGPTKPEAAPAEPEKTPSTPKENGAKVDTQKAPPPATAGTKTGPLVDDPYDTAGRRLPDARPTPVKATPGN